MNELRNRIRWNDDSGIAMLMAIGFMLTMSVIVAAATAYALNVIPQTQNGLSSTRALAAAQAGIDHYLGHLNQDRNYFETMDCENPALEGPHPDPGLVVNNCNYSASTPTGWVPMSSSDISNGEFHYDVDTSDMDQFTIWLASTGRADGVSRTLQAKISIAGSQRYLYVTDFEDADPENQVAYPSLPSHNDCGRSGSTLAKYWWQPQPNERSKSGSPDCQEIQFIAADVLDGPVHFNDMPLINGNTQFRQGFTTYSVNCPKTPVTTRAAAVDKCFRGSGTPNLSSKGARWANVNSLPDTTGDLINKPGCQYTGDTRIRFNSNGTMDVWNTRSVGTTLGTVGNPAVEATAPNCGNAANYKVATGQKYPASKQTVPVPDGMVIYVKNSSSSAPCVPGQVVNNTVSGSVSGDTIPQGSGTTNAGVTDISYSNPTWRKTRASASGGGWTVPPLVQSNSYPTKNDCGLGNVYVEGTVTGRVTIAAENNVYLTGDLLVAGISAGDAPSRENRNIVGLVAQNSVVAYHPVGVSSWSMTRSSTSVTCPASPSSGTPSGGSTGSWCQWAPSSYTNLSYPNATTPTSRRWIYASIQTLAHSFWVSSYNQGNPTGYLSVRGSIAQRWRGIVGTGSISTGYIKDYKYDQRLQTTSPPYFPPWANGEWAAETTGELPGGG